MSDLGESGRSARDQRESLFGTSANPPKAAVELE